MLNIVALISTVVASARATPRQTSFRCTLSAFRTAGRSRTGTPGRQALAFGSRTPSILHALSVACSFTADALTIVLRRGGVWKWALSQTVRFSHTLSLMYCPSSSTSGADDWYWC